MPLRIKPIFILALLALPFAGCANLNPFSKGNPDLKANQELKAKWVGKSADSFFEKFGPAAYKSTNSGGDFFYVWSKREDAVGSNYFCDLRLIANSRGNLTSIEITGVSTGKSRGNYCDEISW
jgi:hypothetical protein